MRRAGREFGSEDPKVIYVALRWNDESPTKDQEQKMIRTVAKKLNMEEKDKELRIYNLCRPKRGLGMALSIDELDDVEQTIQRIKACGDNCRSVKLIVVGGRSGPMPLVALMLKIIIPQVRIEIRNHHKARSVDGGPLKKFRVLRPKGTKPLNSKN